MSKATQISTPVLAIVFVFTFLTGCNADNGSTDVKQTEQSPSASRPDPQFTFTYLLCENGEKPFGVAEVHYMRIAKNDTGRVITPKSSGFWFQTPLNDLSRLYYYERFAVTPTHITAIWTNPIFKRKNEYSVDRGSLHMTHLITDPDMSHDIYREEVDSAVCKLSTEDEFIARETELKNHEQELKLKREQEINERTKENKI